MFSDYLHYRARLQALNLMPYWHKVNGFTNGLDMTKGTYYPALDVFSKSITEAGRPHAIMTYEEFKEDRNDTN